MSLLPGILRKLFNLPVVETDPEKAYDLWAAAYDAQPDNLMLLLDQQVFTGLLNETEIKDKTVVDIGCGTGRHWKEILSRNPRSLTGYDVSAQMLQVLKQKFPQQKAVRLLDNKVDEPLNSCDIIISTLALAHIPDPEAAIRQWSQILKPGGEMIITDYHPEALTKGGNRTFRYNNKLVAVKNYVHPLNRVLTIAKQLELTVLRTVERKIGEDLKAFYEKQNALPVYEKFRGVPIIYGIHLKKADVIM
jgi:ubiquinone/menaquinone biosynthesis C-methylase UbiE